MSHVLTALLVATLVITVFRAYKIPVTRRTVAVTGMILLVLSTVGLLTSILWHGAAPVSHQITVTRFIVALNPDQKALIKSINVGIGDDVKKGDVLFELDKKQFQAAVDQYAADLQAAKAEADNLQAAVELSEATIKRLEAQASSADADRDAAQELLKMKSPSASKLNVERLTRTAEAADAAVVEARASNRQAGFALASGRANIASVQGLLDNAQADLDRTTYTAPADA